MTTVVFVGPSLRRAARAVHAGVVFAPPAAAGDVHRAVRAGARVVGLVDGVFEDRPTVGHKEILWALSKGVAVVGGASLGALRAVECAAYGMRGVGSVYADYRDGRRIDDHAVALIHAPEALDYAPLSEPLVTVDATLDAAQTAGVVTPTEADALRGCAEAIFYQALTWPALTAAARAAGAVDAQTLAALEAWLPQGRRDIKREDAEAVVALVSLLAAAPPAAPVFHFSDTLHWRRARTRFEAFVQALSAEDMLVLDELRLQPVRYEREVERAFGRAAVAASDGDAPSASLSADDAVRAFRAAMGLAEDAAFAAWLRDAGMTRSALSTALHDEDRYVAALEAAAPRLAQAMSAELKLSGADDALRARARRKAAALGTTPPAEASVEALMARFYESRGLADPPLDADEAAQALGLADVAALATLLAREFAFVDGGGS